MKNNRIRPQKIGTQQANHGLFSDSVPCELSSAMNATPELLYQALERFLKPAQVGQWLKSPNPAFDGSTPLQLVERGEVDRIWRMLFDLESGQPG